MPVKRIAEADLTRAALAKGAVVSIDGRTINAAGQQLAVAKRVEKPTEPPAPPPAAEPLTLDTSGLERAAAAGQQQTQALAQVIAALVGEMRAQRNAAPAPIVGWDFELEHKDGRLCGIYATAKR